MVKVIEKAVPTTYKFERRPLNPEWVISFNETLTQIKERKLEAELLKQMQIEESWSSREPNLPKHLATSKKALETDEDEMNAYRQFARDQKIACEVLIEYGLNVNDFLSGTYNSNDKSKIREMNAALNPALYSTLNLGLPINFAKPF